MQSHFDGVFLKRTAQFRAGILRERRRSSVATIDNNLTKDRQREEAASADDTVIINFDTRLNLHNPLDYTKIFLFLELLILIGSRTNLLIAVWLTLLLINRLAKKNKSNDVSKKTLFFYEFSRLILDFLVVEISKKISLTKKRGKNEQDTFSITKSFFSLSHSHSIDYGKNIRLVSSTSAKQVGEIQFQWQRVRLWAASGVRVCPRVRDKFREIIYP